MLHHLVDYVVCSNNGPGLKNGPTTGIVSYIGLYRENMKKDDVLLFYYPVLRNSELSILVMSCQPPRVVPTENVLKGVCASRG